MRLFSLLGLTCLFFGLGKVHQTAGQQSLHFNRLSVRQGLSHGLVYCIHQDRQGFMWFGTGNGLNKYDGNTFHVYQHDPTNPDSSLRHNIVWDMLESRTGQLWAATVGEGIHLIDKRTGKAIAYRTTDPSRNICYQISEDNDGIFWLATAGGLTRFDPRTNRFVLFPPPAPDQKTAWSVLVDQQGRVWVGTSKGLYWLNRQTGKLVPVTLAADQPLQTHFVLSLYEDTNRQLWVASLGKGLFRLYPAKNVPMNQWDRRFYPLKYNVFPNGMVDQSADRLWVGTQEGGLRQLNKQSGQWTAHQTNASITSSLSNNSVLSVYKDPSGILWAGTDNGVNQVIDQARKFVTHQFTPDPASSRLPHNIVITLCEDKQGIIWVSNALDGLYRFDRQRNQFFLYPHRPDKPGALRSKHVSALLVDRTDALWIGTDEGLYRRNPATDLFTRYPTSIQVSSIQQDASGDIWIGGRGGIARLDQHRQQLISYLNTDSQINRLLISRTGDIWIAFSGEGLGRLTPANGRVTHFLTSDTVRADRLNNRDVLALYEDSKGRIWVGTNSGGLNCFVPRTARFTAFTMEDGLPSNHVSGILGDRAGMVWLATDKGLCRFDPERRTCRNYDERDGLQDTEFTRASAQGPNGDLLFGGRNGFNVFQPTSLRDNRNIPAVYITGLKVLTKDRPIPASGEVTLSHRENFLSFDFVALNYLLTEKNQYAYQLTGVDQNWIANGTRHDASYTKLAPGRYVFRVKASNNDGLWNERGASLAIVIRPPWWANSWAYTGYVLVLMGGIWGFIRYRSRALRRANRLLEEQVAWRTKQLQQSVHDLRTTQAQLVQKEKMASLGELTAGIAHEIQNPLNFVNNFSEVSTELVEELSQDLAKGDIDDAKAIADDLIQNLEKINQHGERAASIVRSMLEHTRVSQGERQPTDLNTLVNTCLQLTYKAQKAKNSTVDVTLLTDFDSRLKPVELIAQDIDRVLTNVLANAFYAVNQKQATGQPNYRPTVTVSTKQTDNTVDIRVRDNGNGIPPGILTKLFQPFFTTKPAGTGVGLGLSLSYDIVTKGHDGTLSATSQEGEFAEFIISLPVQDN